MTGTAAEEEARITAYFREKFGVLISKGQSSPNLSQEQADDRRPCSLSRQG